MRGNGWGVFWVTIGACVLIAFIAWMVEADAKYWAECEARGGKRVHTGYVTQMMLVGKVMVPRQNPTYECRQ